ncbi:MAG: undecaprenyl-diphosphate phosphatase, partial [Desulfamplus sp.]|nr:undecaprenyl-diphosphate phosphatase [Desulfamplus sp.]
YQALLLGMIQGLTEFLPVSSSGHLALGHYSFGITVPTLFFDISLHIGTLAAVVIVFFDSIKLMTLSIMRMMTALIKFNLNDFKMYVQNDPDVRLAFLIIVGSIPTALLGLFLKQYVDTMFDSINFVGTMLLVTGTFLWMTKDINKDNTKRAVAAQTNDSDLIDHKSSIKDKFGIKENDVSGKMKGVQVEPGSCTADLNIMKFSYKQALLIGLCQGVAVVPGISRSGSTIVAGLFAGVERETAAKFSFLLSIPAILGAELLGIKDLVGSGVSPDITTLWGAIIAFITGYVALKVLMRIVRKGKLHLFAPYCWFLGTVAVIAGVL